MSKCVKAKPVSRVVVSLSLPLEGYTIDELVDDLDNRVVVDSVSALLAAGANPNKLANQLMPLQIAENLDKLLAAGAKIDADWLANRMLPGQIDENMSRLLAAGANPNKLVSRLERWQIARHRGELLTAKANQKLLRLRDCTSTANSG